MSSDSNPLNARLVAGSSSSSSNSGGGGGGGNSAYEPLDACEASNTGTGGGADNIAAKNPSSTSDSIETPGQYLPTCLFLMAFVLNICTLGLFGLHWAYLWLNGPAGSRRDCLFHFVSYLVAAGLLSLGIWCRSSYSGVLDCPNGEEMSVHCLYHTQPPLYQFVYTIHYFGLGWIVLHLVMDMMHFISWCVDIYLKKDVLSMFYSGWWGGRDGQAVAIGSSSSTSSSCSCSNGKKGSAGAVAGAGGTETSSICQYFPEFLKPANYTYFHWLFFAWVMVTLTWTVFVDWSTGDANGVQGLGSAEISQMVGYYVLICVYYYV